ncbi:hypothetical protein [Chitinivibrio alkaliphilus]|uniref:Uncharacterized protein n=1 Tax=Chitinivibrio alkaliphilus ACht1 TaxID=1313304 RepID=U7D427_9BACT|nr:hypothetical protein [Chitinivibrio alkaliphilus]ERP30708.1 hypothetical protein CALK_2471 [Chitinivibrio alkaliphilus ACht1]
MRHSFALLILSVCFTLAASDISLSGAASLGVLYHDMSVSLNDSVYVYDEDIQRHGKLTTDIAISPLSGITLRTDLAFDIDDEALHMGTFDVRFSLGGGRQIRAGYMKKRLSFEERLSHDERQLIDRSILHERIRSFHLPGRDFTLAYRHRRDNRTYWHAVAADMSHRYSMIHRLEWELASSLEASSSLTVTHGSKSPDSVHVITGNMALNYDQAAHRGEIEIMGGTNPSAERIQRQMNEEMRILYGGIRLCYSYGFQRPEEYILETIRPIVEGVYLLDNHETGKTSLQFRPGLSVGIIDADIAELLISGDFQYGTLPPHHGEYTRRISGGAVRVRIRW